MLAFMSAKKSRLIRDFIAVLGAMILWTGGSLLMRLRAWPSYELWFHLSLAGISLVPCAFFCFIRDFCGHKAKSSHRMWLVLILLVNLYKYMDRKPGPAACYRVEWSQRRVCLSYGLACQHYVRTLLPGNHTYGRHHMEQPEKQGPEGQGGTAAVRYTPAFCRQYGCASVQWISH